MKHYLILSLFLLSSCDGVNIQGALFNLGGASGNGDVSSGSGITGGSGGGPYTFNDSFGVNGDITVTSANWTNPTAFEAPIVAGSGMVAASTFASFATYAGPEDVTYNYQEIELVSLTGTPRSGLITHLSSRLTPALETYSCIFGVDNGTGNFTVGLMRSDIPSASYNWVTSPAIDTGVNATTQAGTPFLLACETVQVAGVDHLRAYISSDINAVPVMIADYTLGTHGSDPTVIPTGSVGLGMYADNAAIDHTITSYSLYDSNPH